MEVAMVATIAERAHPAPLSFEDLAWLVYAEYTEMPGTRLTFEQAKRLFNLSTADCRRVLDYLVANGRLVEDAGHRYCRHDDAACW